MDGQGARNVQELSKHQRCIHNLEHLATKLGFQAPGILRSQEKSQKIEIFGRGNKWYFTAG